LTQTHPRPQDVACWVVDHRKLIVDCREVRAQSTSQLSNLRLVWCRRAAQILVPDQIQGCRRLQPLSLEVAHKRRQPQDGRVCGIWRSERIEAGDLAKQQKLLDAD